MSSTRRGFLALAGGAVGAGTVLPVGAAAAVEQAHPDVELLSLIAQFNGLEHHILAFYEKDGPFYIEDDDERDEAIEPFKVKQEALLPQICSTRAVTRDGTAAKAQMLHLWASDIVDGLDSPDWIEQMMAGIMLDLLPESASASPVGMGRA